MTGDAGDGGACDIASLFRLHHVELVRLAFLLVGDKPTAEDVVQDVFGRMHVMGDRLSSRDDGALAYARAAVVNGCRSVLRRRATMRRLSDIYDRPPGAGRALPARLRPRLNVRFFSPRTAGRYSRR